MKKIDWEQNRAAIWRSKKGQLRPVSEIDEIKLDELLSIDSQKNLLVENTARFLSGNKANNALLWGARGTGKSSLIKALLNEFSDEGLRIIEIDKEDLIDLPEIVDDIRSLPQRFIIYCDDLSFSEGEKTYQPMKRVLDGSIEKPAENIIIYATSNRRHLIPESAADNTATNIVDGELHHGDAVEDKLSLADRFGLWLSFYPASWQEYFQMIDHYFADFSGDRKQLHESARQFALIRSSHSGRTAKQFYLSVDR